ncbi:pentatricopeptide repeat-containing protein [Nicotiana attenuata]|uniref:Pentatricopeptide repeat-containing protein n=1 Tax=Nicotiana attenuata TaxID=49451 RepID=A0A1J6J1R5_NICAT|nr:pentatricopeptide repeat-containing protein [Nicotiana attenuata]
MDLKSDLRKAFISKPIVLRRTLTTCKGASSVASIAKCFKGALEPYNLMKLAGYQPFDATFVSMISLCSTLAPFRQGQQIHSNDIRMGEISVVAIVSPLFIMYSTSRCFAVAARNFEDTGEADIVLCTLDFIRDIVFDATMFEIVPWFHLVESYLVGKQFAANLMMFTVGVRLSNKPIVVVGGIGSRKSLFGSLRERLCVLTRWQVFMCILNIRTLQFSWLRIHMSLVTQNLAFIILLENNFYGMPAAAMVEFEASISITIVLALVHGYIFFFGHIEHFGLAIMGGETTTHIVLCSNLEDKTFEHTYVAEFFMEPETIAELCPDKYFMENLDGIPANEILPDEMTHEDEHRKSNVEFNDHHKLSRFPFDLASNFLDITMPVTATILCVWDPGISSEFRALTDSIENMKAHALFEEVKKGSCLFAKLDEWEHGGRVEMSVEYSCDFRNSCASYELPGESIAHSFMYSFDGVPTHLEAHYMITQLSYVRVPNSTVLKLHQPSKVLAMMADKEGWKSTVQANFLKLDKGMHYVNLMEESKLEHDNAQYVIIVDMFGRSSQLVHAENYIYEIV